MQQEDKLSKIIAGLIGLIFFGAVGIRDISERCVSLPQNECRSLWLLFGLAIIGGILLTEVYAKSKIQEGLPINATPNQSTKRSSTQIWGTSIVRIILSSFLLGLPIIFQGAFVASVSGAFIGIIINVLYRRLTNQWVHP